MTTFNDHGRFWEIDADDILTFNKHDDPNSGLRGIRIRKIVLIPNDTGDGVQFQTLQPSSTPSLTLTADTFTVSTTNTITDDTGSALTQSACTAGNWLHLTNSASGNNEGWWHITGNDASHNYVTVANGTNALTDETSQYDIKVYIPELCMMMISATGKTANEPVMSEPLDWGDKGRHFINLAMYALSTSASVHIYLL